MRPTVSVITVCRNNADTIGACLRSVKAQRDIALEHVVVDGASTDGTQSIIRATLRDGDRMISEPDKGIYNAMNKGWKLATGDYVAFLNADDFYAEDGVVARMIDVAAREDVDVVLGDVRFFRPDNRHHYVRHYRSAVFRPSRLRWGIMPAHPGMFMRRGLLEQLGGFREDLAIAADFDLCVRAFHGLRCTYRHVDLDVVDMATGGVSTRGLKAKLQINREVIKACRENGVYSNALMVMGKYPFKLLELVSIRRVERMLE